MNQAELWAAQLEAFPDSAKLTHEDINLLTTPAHRNSWDRDAIARAHAVVDKELRRNHIERYLKHRTERALDLARTVIFCMQDHPHGIFYACGKQEDGSYRYVGHRYGLKPSQYSSGFQCDNVELLPPRCNCGDATPYESWEEGWDGYPRCPSCQTS